MNKSISIIIPMYNLYNFVKNRLWEIYSNCSPHLGALEVIIVDDASPHVDEEEVRKDIEWWNGSGTYIHPIRYIRSVENRGFGGNVNWGVDISNADIVIVLSTDVEIRGNIVAEVLSHLNGKRTLVGGRLLDFDTGWNTFDGKEFPYLEGWLLATRKKWWIELGGFDERYGLFDYEDVDLSTTALSKGFELKALSPHITEHYSGASIVPEYGLLDRMEITKSNKERFKEKWVKEN